ncbi:hypothetical protein PspLS_02659 [Pyricularia sp. CBS 133598]|nr:hypothetical protein PspLS_02659 [Pyricularia sp. CBS 133598]
MKSSAALVFTLLARLCAAQTDCKKVIVPNYQAPRVAPGWQAQVVASGLKKPRSIEFDTEGGLLVVDAGAGVFRLVFEDHGGTCLEEKERVLLINNTALNHGLALSADGNSLFASTVQSVFRWDYDAKSSRANGSPQEIITGMRNQVLTTRTLTMAKKAIGMLLVSRGSGGDEDTAALAAARDVNSGTSQIRAFDTLRTSEGGQAWEFNRAGRRMGWGLRNAVAVAEHPITGGIYSMDHSVDGIERNGTDISLRNPGEELNFHGFLNATEENQGGNYGYPVCHAVGDPSRIPDGEDLEVGSQFGINTNASNSDAACNGNYTAPRLVFPAHYGPMDLKFNKEGNVAFLSFRGSMSKINPVGYRVSTVDFDASSGQPKEPSNSTTALKDLIFNGDGHNCPDNCMRPVGLAWDVKGRLWVTADSTGEIYVLERQLETPTTGHGIMVMEAAKSAAGSVAPWGGLGLLLHAVVAVFAIL